MPQSEPQTCPWCDYKSRSSDKMIEHVSSKHLPRSRPASDLGSYRDQMLDAGREHLLGPNDV